jgi:hypothetical protein
LFFLYPRPIFISLDIYTPLQHLVVGLEVLDLGYAGFWIWTFENTSSPETMGE